MKIYFTLAIILIAFQVYSQTEKERKGRTESDFKSSFNDGEISGYVFDNQNKTPLEAVSVQLIKSRDSSIHGGTETDAAGFFKISGISQGKYRLIVTLTGYNKKIITADMINPDIKKIFLDTLFLNSGTETEEIVVQSERPFMELKGEKKIFNVGENMSVKGGTAIDILKNLPSVTVDIDNNISLRGGSNIKFFINGRPVTGNVSRILEQLPADQLSSVEVITNPSAKYEAEGSTGVINLVLKQYDDAGVNGQIDLSSGTKDKYGSGININYKTSKYKALGSLDIRLHNMTMNAIVDRNNFFSEDQAVTNQTSDGMMRREGNNFRSEFEYYISKSDILNLNFRFNNGKRKRGDTDNMTIYNSQNVVSEISKNVSEEEETENGYSLGLNYGKYGKDGQTLTGEISYTLEKENDNGYRETMYTLPEGLMSDYYDIEGSDNDKLINIQSDYIYKFSKQSGFETGIKYNINDRSTNEFNYLRNNETGIFAIDSSLSDDFNYLEKTASAYGIYSNETKDFSYNLGLRGEYWDLDMDDKFYNSTSSKNKFDFFPSVSLSYKLSMTEQIGLNYSRKIRRPGFRELSPSTRVMSPVLYMRGNPLLEPEYFNSIELNFSKFFNSFSIIPSVFYKIKNNVITRSSTLIDSNIVLNVPVNADNEISYGGEFLVNGQFGKIFNLNMSISYFNQEITSDTLGTNSSNTFSGRLFSNINLPFDAGIQLTYFYSGKMITPQGTVDPMSSFDVSLKKEFMNRQLSVSLRISDLFNQGKFTGVSSTELYMQEFSRARESRIAMLSLTYKFGSDTKSSDRKKRGNRNQDEQDRGSDIDF
ncbi:MAG: hypothetical protein HGGPFJEG_00590 [Ignavibacteria bacterium]|nr:hypothetical protein [Ignavibacteria bacterium]